MLSIAEVKGKMSYFAFPFLLFVLVPYTISLGSCDHFSFSICWMFTDDTVQRSDGNIWLNSTALKSIGKQGTFTSMTLFPNVENKLTLQYGGHVHTWTFSITPMPFTLKGTNSTEIRGVQKPQQHPINTTQETLALLASEVFACENGTLFFHQDDKLILAIGHTLRLPVKLESRRPSMLLVSWMENVPATPDPGSAHAVSLYHSVLQSYAARSVDSTTNNHYRFTGLQSCSPYVTCVQLAGTRSLTCLSVITDPDVPQHFQVRRWNSTSITVAWDCPENRRFSLFLLTVLFLDGSDRVAEERLFWHREDRLVFTLTDLPPCSRARFGLQTVCLEGRSSRYSDVVEIDGNSVHSNIEALRQTSSGPDNYTVSWEVRNTSSISTFRVYHQGALQGYTLLTNHTVGGLLPCRQYLARVEALCGDSVLMTTKTITVHTGPRGVSDLRYRSQDSVALWTAGTVHRPSTGFLYELTLENGTAVQSGRLSEPALRLPGLVDGHAYVLDVWEECDGLRQADPALVCFDGVSVPFEPRVLALGPEDDLDESSSALVLVVPWSLTEILLDSMLEPRAKMEDIIKTKLEELLAGFSQPARVQLVTFDPSDEDGKTKIYFKSFDASTLDGPPSLVRDGAPPAGPQPAGPQLDRDVALLVRDGAPPAGPQPAGPQLDRDVALLVRDGAPPAGPQPAGPQLDRDVALLVRDGAPPAGPQLDRDVALPPGPQLDYIVSRQIPNITVKDGIIYWDGLDECASSGQCPSDAQCINTLLSFTCVCRSGFYDVGSTMLPPEDKASGPVCNEKGLFSQCLDKLMAGGIAKAYLVSYFGGEISVVLNDGRCDVDENEMFYYFRTSRKSSRCGTRRLVNETHMEFQNILTVTLNREHAITRHDLKVVWQCVYPRNYVRNTQVNVDLHWITSFSLVEFNSSLELGLTMALYSDESFSYRYHYAVALEQDDTLFFQVALQTNNTFASDVLLRVVSCWATESTDPQDQVQGLFLQEGCAVDNTFQWRSANGRAQTSRFSMQMFTMPKQLPIYFHCLAQICGDDGDCTTTCPAQQTTRTSVRKRAVSRRPVVVSAGPLLVSMQTKSGVRPSNWTGHMMLIMAGLIGFLGLTVVGVCATKSIMTYYESLRLQ